jgi:outer membrane murein-binding lipoprotein Lpp
MKKKIFIGVALLLTVALLAGCGGIPQEDYDKAVADKDAAQAQVTSLQTQLNTAKADATKAKSDLTAAQSELTKAKSDLEAAQKEAASAKSAASSAQSQLSTAKTEATKAKSDLTAAQAKVAELEAKIAALEAAAPAEEEEEAAAEEEEEAAAEEEEEAAAEEEEEAAGPTLTFTAATYTNDEYGFTVKYPEDWTEDPAMETGDAVFNASGAPYKIPGVSISISDIVAGKSFCDGLIADQEEAGSTDMKCVSESDTTTFDGVAAKEIIFKYTTSTGYPIDAVVIGVEKDGKRIVVFVYTVGMYAPFSEAQEREVARTLSFK